MVGTEGHDLVHGGGRRHPSGAQRRTEPAQSGDEAELSVDAYLATVDLTALSPRQRARFEIEAEAQSRFTDEAREELARAPFGAGIMRDEPMSNHALFGVGGNVDALITVEAIEPLKQVLAFAGERNVPVIMLGSGSSLLVRDGGIRGMAVKLGAAFSGVETVRDDGEAVTIRAGGAAMLDTLARTFSAQGLEGADRLGGMRATVAGSMMVLPHLLADVVEEIAMVDRGGRELTLTRKALMQSGTFKIARVAAITSALLRVPRCTSSADGGIANENGGTNELKTLGPVFADIGRQRAADIIADAGFAGVRVGRVRVDVSDANVFVNEGGAKAGHALVLVGMIRDRVRQNTGLALETVIRIVGEK